jgi:tRNA-splicing ligase RtcB
MEIQGYHLTKEEDWLYIIKGSGRMRVPVKLFTSEKLLEQIKGDDSIKQACNVATLPGIQGASVVMPDMHQGYGFSIGGVAAFDMQEGVISPGGIGFDINCGVRLLSIPLTVEEVRPRINELLDRLYANCPVGVGSEAKIRLSDEDYQDLMVRGAAWAVEHGYGTKEDLEHCESHGSIPGADPSKASKHAQARGRKQLGTVGAGNHFIEVQQVDQVYDATVAKAFGITGPGQVVVMVHCGSRGFGHQVCTDYIRKMEEEQPELFRSLPDKNLIYAPLGSKLADDYFAAMCAAANYAFANRHVLGHFVRKSFAEVFGEEVAAKVKTVYDICHNIAKKERHAIGGEEREVMVHRKGATRAFPPGFQELPKEYRQYGQPVLIPGSMGTASYILHGTETAMKEAFGSTAHGAGRMMSRLQANRDFTADQVTAELAKKQVTVKAASKHGIVEEAPGAYKDVDEVIRVCHEAGLAKKVARMVPVGVIKG